MPATEIQKSEVVTPSFVVGPVDSVLDNSQRAILNATTGAPTADLLEIVANLNEIRDEMFQHLHARLNILDDQSGDFSHEFYNLSQTRFWLEYAEEALQKNNQSEALDHLTNALLHLARVRKVLAQINQEAET